MKRSPARVGVLISGSGSNLQALIDRSRDFPEAYRIAFVISNKPDALGLVRAREAGIETQIIDHRDFGDRESFEAEIDRALSARAIELVCLAGFMRILTSYFVRRWAGRLINIHPSLLPAFKGLDTHARALRCRVLVHGCTVHEVTEALDDGRIIAQGVVPVMPEDDAQSLAARVLEIEHRCYPQAVLAWLGHGATQGSSVNQVRLLHPDLAEARMIGC